VAAGGMSPEAQARLASRKWRLGASTWLLSPVFAFSLGTGISFVYIGVRAKRRDWWIAGIVYFVVAVVAVSLLSGATSGSTLANIGGGLLWIVWLGGIVHAFLINRAWLRFRAQKDARPWWTEHGEQQEPRGWNGPTPTGTPVQVTGLGIDPAQFYGTPTSSPSGPGSHLQPRPDLVTPPVPGPAPIRSQSTAAARVPAPAIRQMTVDVNTASADELAALPGMTAVRCQALLRTRNQRGRLDSAEEVAQVLGLAPHELVRIRDMMTFSGTRPSEGYQPGGRVVDF
jgi:hypothetical protein